MKLGGGLLACVLVAVMGCGGSETDAPITTCDGPGSWRVGPRLNDPREQAAALLLPDGRVLVVGGHHIDPPNGKDLDSAEIFDPATETWTPTGSMNSVRNATRDRTVVLASGEVLTAEQEENTTEMATIPAELYDASSGTWSVVNGVMTSYVNGPMVALSDGDAVVMAGTDWAALAPYSNAERYHADTGQWTAAASLSGPRLAPSAIAIGDEVLVVGGADLYEEAPGLPFLATAEVYNPDSDQFRGVQSMSEGRWAPPLVVLEDGRVLAVGAKTADIYDPATETWTPTGSMAEVRAGPSLSLLHDGRVLAAGGWGEFDDLSSAEIYDPAEGTWSPAGSMSGRRRLHSAVTLPNGEVLVVGGFHYFQLSTTAIYTPCSN